MTTRATRLFFIPKILAECLRGWVIFISVFFLFSCEHYQIQRHVSVVEGNTVSVPFVEGDKDGEFTRVLVQRLLAQTGLYYREEGGELLLKVKLLDPRREDIGFQYERDNNDQLTNKLVPNEGRLTREFEVLLEAADTHAPLIGPLRLTASVNCDFEFDPIRSNIHTLSLGQIDNIANVGALADNALFHEMAQKIVESINHAW